jgi:hypothetical protein
LTLRELLLMADGRQRSEWSRTSAQMALIANTQRDPKKTRAFRPSDFDPYSRAMPVMKTDIGALKTVFIDKSMPKEVLKQ